MAFRIEIPSSHRKGIETLAKLSDAQLAGLKKGLGEAGYFLDKSNFEKKFSEVSGLDEATTSMLLEVLVGFFYSLDETGYSTDRFANDLVSSAKETGVIDSKLLASLEKNLRDILPRVFESAALEVTAKAAGIIAESKNPVINVRVITDIRPIFTSNAKVKIDAIAAVIVHNLKIETMEKESHYFALDSKDLRTLRKHIDRAIEKESLLIKRIEKTDLRYLPVGE